MENFSYFNPTKIIFGKDTEKNVGDEVTNFSKKVLLVYGSGSIKKTGLYNKVTDSLKKADVEYMELSGVLPNPRLSLVYKGIDLCKKEKIDFVLAVGGGSCIDTAKAIALGVPYSGDVWDFYSRIVEPRDALPIGTILTIPAAGSESSPASVITKEEGWLKRSASSDLIRPEFSILNPELCFTLPSNQIVNGISDMIAHLMERYFTNTKNVELTDRLIEVTMKTIINNAPIIYNDHTNYDAWAEIMWAGTIAHNGLLNTGREGDWGSHKIEHELSGIYDVAHGAGLSVVFPAWMKYVYKNDTTRFAQFATKIWGVKDNNNDDKTAQAGIEALIKFFMSLNLPVTLKELNIPFDRLEEMAQKCTDDDTRQVGKFVALKTADVLKILKLAE